MVNFCSKHRKLKCRGSGAWIFGLLILALSQLWQIPGLAAEASGTATSVKAPPLPATWKDVALEKRCEGLLEFLEATTSSELANWTLLKPKCVIAGGASGDVSWSIDAIWRLGRKSHTLRFAVTEVKAMKPQVSWCVVDGKKAGCAAPWENAFTQGSLFKTPEAAKAAFAKVVADSQGFLGLVTKVDGWIAGKGGTSKIFDLSYPEWVKAWSQDPRTLPVNSEQVVAQFALDGTGGTTGSVKFRGDIPPALRKCLGCATTPCDRTTTSFVFAGLGLTMTRELSAAEQTELKKRDASVSWIMTEPVSFEGQKPKWPFLCGEHRFNIQKF